MQNNVTELTHKLLRSLDSNYNVIDMPAVIETISVLEKVAITKELLEATRLGKHVNELRRNTRDDSLAKRAKELVKKWRSMVLPDSNGQLKSAPESCEDSQNHKRPLKDPLQERIAKRFRVNGQVCGTELEFSDNSNSSFKDTNITPPVIINSDSNSSIPEIRQDHLLLEHSLPKKRGRRKGSKIHRNLVEEAETSFSNKLNVSRGNAKVKTTQELLADLQIRSSGGAALHIPAKPLEDLNERAAKLTQRVSIIDQQLNANSTRYRNFQKRNSVRTNVVPVETEFVKTAPQKLSESPTNDDDIIIVDDVEDVPSSAKPEAGEDDESEESSKVNVPTSLETEDALAQLPAINYDVLQEDDVPEFRCACAMVENKTDFSVEADEEVNTQLTYSFLEDPCCCAKSHLEGKYNIRGSLDDYIDKLHSNHIPCVTGVFGLAEQNSDQNVPEKSEDFISVVPHLDDLPKITTDLNSVQPASENFKKYSISEGGTSLVETKSDQDRENIGSDIKSEPSDILTFREWHHVVKMPSYNGEVLKILPYVIID